MGVAPRASASSSLDLLRSEEAGDRAKSSGLFHRVFLKPVKLARIKEAIDELLAERGFFVGAIAGT